MSTFKNYKPRTNVLKRIDRHLRAIADSINHPGRKHQFLMTAKYDPISALMYAKIACFGYDAQFNEEFNLRMRPIDIGLEEMQQMLDEVNNTYFDSSAFDQSYIFQCANTKRAYKLLSPKGEVHVVHSVSEFCRKKGITLSAFYDLFTGAVKSARGWRKYPPPNELDDDRDHGRFKNSKGERRIFELMSPDGELHKVVNVSRFCRRHGIHPNYFYDVVRGECSQYKGWSLYKGEKLEAG
jgi:hypothetical protein